MGESSPEGPGALTNPATAEEWKPLFATAREWLLPALPVIVVLPGSNAPRTWSSPSLVVCQGAGRVFVKQAILGATAQTRQDRMHARSVVNEQVTGQLGMLMGAPVARTVLVEVTDRTSQPATQTPLPRGVHHGSVLIEDLGAPVKRPNEWRRVDVALNRDRFAVLAILYGWVYCSYDHQVSFETTPPRRVWCYDHGFTIGLGRAPLQHGGDAQWDRIVLANRRAVAVDRVFQQSFQFSAGELRRAVAPLASIDAARIAAVIASIPDDWYCTDDERVALASYLNDRRLQLLNQ